MLVHVTLSHSLSPDCHRLHTRNRYLGYERDIITSKSDIVFRVQ